MITNEREIKNLSAKLKIEILRGIGKGEVQIAGKRKLLLFGWQAIFLTGKILLYTPGYQVRLSWYSFSINCMLPMLPSDGVHPSSLDQITWDRNMAYSRYVRAYNGCRNSGANTLIQSTAQVPAANVTIINEV